MNYTVHTPLVLDYLGHDVDGYDFAEIGGGQYGITRWELAAPQPTPEQIAAEMQSAGFRDYVVRWKARQFGAEHSARQAAGVSQATLNTMAATQGPDPYFAAVREWLANLSNAQTGAIVAVRDAPDIEAALAVTPEWPAETAPNPIDYL